MRIVFGTDERRPTTDAIKAWIERSGHEMDVAGEGDPWPDVGHRVGRAVADGAAERGVVCCSTGTGVSIAANKVAGVRAALCTDVATAVGARRWNDANVLAIGLDGTDPDTAVDLLEAFLGTEVDAEEAPTIARVE
jgi:ribose 5-phosphate isomerase B